MRQRIRGGAIVQEPGVTHQARSTDSTQLFAMPDSMWLPCTLSKSEGDPKCVSTLLNSATSLCIKNLFLTTKAIMHTLPNA